MASIPGTWTLKYSWGCSTSYGTTSITFNADGTFTTTEGGNGKWVQIEGKIVWRFNVSNTVYAGTITGNVMAGVMSTFSGGNGCWYAFKSGVAADAAADADAADAQQLDSAGNTRGGKAGSKKRGGSKK